MPVFKADIVPQAGYALFLYKLGREINHLHVLPVYHVVRYL